MGGTKRSRSGRQRVNARPNTSTARRKEEAEMARVEKSVSAIPRYSNRFQIFRQNRRQKAKRISDLNAQGEAEQHFEHPSFRATQFTDLPLSSRTLDGLAAANFSELTGIQKTSIPQALAGRDVLAAAPTGSGKTLAFLVPLLEILWRNKWNTLDGLGALIISPTRELSMQIFEVLRSVARRHMISAGLVIGGKDFESEREKVGNMNVLVATPGRLLHHMDHVAELDCSNMKVLVLDEADRILDMGFAKTLDAILTNLPKKRQTMLFSATQTKNVKSLARLSLSEPEYVAVHSRPTSEDRSRDKEDRSADAEAPDETPETDSIRVVGTPTGLTQSYTVVAAHDKLSVLWSFIKTHLKSKIIVFFSSGKQVRFAFETFCKLRPGMSLLHIHGNMKQLKRTDMYDLFCRTKSAALFATDVASRGLDFPDVEWVIQLDCPDDVGTYVHRVGRTARFKSQGRALLFLNEGKEERFLDRLKSRNLGLTRTRINPGRIHSIEPRIAATVASNQELRKLAQRAFMFYVKSIYQQSDKEVFDVTELDFDKLAKSFGLSVVPRVSFRKGGNEPHAAKESKENAKTVFGYRQRTEHVPNEDERPMPKRGATHKPEAAQNGSSDEGEGELLTVRQTHDGDDVRSSESARNADAPEVPAERRKRKKRKLDLLGGLPSANRIVFTEDGKAIRAGGVAEEASEQTEEGAHHGNIEEYAASVAKRLAEAAVEDKDRERERVRSMHARRRARERERNKTIRPSPDTAPVLVGAEDVQHPSSDEAQASESSSEDEDGHGKSLEEDELIALQVLQSRK